MITVAWAPPDLGMRGITDASATHKLSTSLTLQYWSTTAIGSVSGPILQVPDTCIAVPTVWLIQRSRASSLARMSFAGRIRVVRSGLQQQYGSLTVCCQSAGQHTSSRSPADDYHVIFHELSLSDIPRLLRSARLIVWSFGGCRA